LWHRRSWVQPPSFAPVLILKDTYNKCLFCYNKRVSHIHTQLGQHDQTASAFIVRLDVSKPSIMLHRHKKIKKYLQFGGHVELHENPWQTITHELLEESGYDLDQLQLLQPRIRLQSLTDATLHPMPVSYTTHKFMSLDHFHTDTAFALTAMAPPRHNVGDNESTEIKLFTADELRAIPADQIPENVREIALFVLEEILPTWETIDAVKWASFNQIFIS
jgi:8-oxo-dGTP diphosphatase